MYDLVILLCVLAIASIAVVVGAAAIMTQPAAARRDPSGAALSIRGIAKGRVRGPTGLLLALGGLALAAFAYTRFTERYDERETVTAGKPATVTGTVVSRGGERDSERPLAVVLARSEHTRYYGSGLPDNETEIVFQVPGSGQYYVFAFNVVSVADDGRTLYDAKYAPVTVSDEKGVFSLELRSGQ